MLKLLYIACVFYFERDVVVVQVTFMEFKLRQTDLTAAVGQIITRAHHLFELQPGRTVAYALALCLDSVQLCRMTKLAVSGGIKLEATKELPLSIGKPAALWTGDLSAPCTVENLAPGLLILAQLLSTSPENLGYHPPRLPVTVNVGNSSLVAFQSLRQGRIGVFKGSCLLVFLLRNASELEKKSRSTFHH